MDCRISVFLLVTIWVCFAQVSGQNPEVEIGLGRLQGYYETVQRDSDTYTVKDFLGIPFAKPPVGDLRFRKPVPVDSLGSNPYNATYYRPYCPHLVPGMDPYTASDNTEDEDCLYLNVFVPDMSPDSGDSHAVMVWIYGGGFAAGAASDYHSAMIAASGNVIVVTLGYRISMFGFMSTMDEHAPGNYGMFDQVLAINWVHENIAAFGGDPSRVTVFGESAGAMSASFQGLYQENHGKIHRIIAQSGTGNTPFYDPSADFLEATRTVARLLNCPTANTRELVDCMRTPSWQQFKETVQSIASQPEYMFLIQSIGPRMDGAFIKADFRNLSHVYESYGRGAIEFSQSLDMLLGTNMYEGADLLMFISDGGDLETFTVTAETMPAYINNLAWLGVVDGAITMATNMVIAHEYTDWTDPRHSDLLRIQLAKMVGDVGFVAPAVEMARMHSTPGSGDRHTFVYEFRPIPTFRLPYMPSWVPGAGHGEEIGTLFANTYPYMAPWEQQLSDRMVTYWSNFAKTGDPNTPRTVSHTWTPYNHTHQAYMALDKDTGDNPVHHYFAARETQFWRQTIPAIQAKVTSGKPGDCDGAVSSVAQLMSSSLMLLLSVFVSLF